MAGLTEGREVSLEDLQKAVGDVQTVGGVTFTTPSHAEAVTGDPFGDSLRMVVDSPPNVVQLQDELEEALGAEVSLSLAWSEEDRSGVLHVSPGPQEARQIIEETVAAHCPDPRYGLTEEDSLRSSVFEKIRQGEDLDLREVNVAIRALVGKVITVTEERNTIEVSDETRGEGK